LFDGGIVSCRVRRRCQKVAYNTTTMQCEMSYVIIINFFNKKTVKTQLVTMQEEGNENDNS